ncbi:MAG TPA: hypothetical protein VF459_17885 [Caulobacteraceae bacterium]
MAYVEENAKRINNWVRKFFDGPEHAGSKSDNKRYDAPPQEGVTLKPGQSDRRNAHIATANQIRQTIRSEGKKLNGPMPAQMGEIIFKGKFRGGNCAEMTWLCCHGFVASKAHIWVAIIDDPGDHQFCILMDKEPDYKSIELMDYRGDDQWIIDPWAGIVCKPGEFKETFTKQMLKWTAAGKRIGVPNAKKDGYIWTPGTETKYLDAILKSGLKFRKGWNF